MKNYSYKGTLIALMAILLAALIYKFMMKQETRDDSSAVEATRPTFAYEVVPAEIHAMPTE